MCLHSICRYLKINTVVNLVFLLFSAVIFYAWGDSIYQMHSHMFGITRESFNAIFYGLLGLYKLYFWMFNVVPLIALCCICKCRKNQKPGCCGNKECQCCGPDKGACPDKNKV